jgi:small subunit ribosomal protein S5
MCACVPLGNSRGDEQAGADGFTERLVQVRRVTKVVKGGKQLSFRAVVVAGNGQGEVGVGCASAKEVRTRK